MEEQKLVFRVTYVGVSHDQWGFRVAGFYLDQLLQRGGGHPGHSLPLKGECLWARHLGHELMEKALF